MIAALLLAGSLYAASMSAGDRPLPATAFEIHAQKVAEGSSRDAVWLVASGFADVYSTAIGLDRCPDCYESNWFLPNSEARIAAKAVATGIAWAYLRDLRQAEKHNRADWIRRVFVAFNLALAANNTVRAVRGR